MWVFVVTIVVVNLKNKEAVRRVDLCNDMMIERVFDAGILVNTWR